jgi:hypothetical protein
MTWLLRLYPSPWRRRYGDEVAELLAHQGFSLRIAVDLIAGAIDVWLHPSATLSAAGTATTQEPVEEKPMLSRIARLDCSAAGAYTKQEQWQAAGAAVGGTIVLTLVWMAAHIRLGDNAYVDSLSVLTYTVPTLFSMRYTYLKERSASVQAVFILGLALVLAGIMLAAGWVAGRL